MTRTLYYGQPINWADPLNRGLVLVERWQVLPWYAGGPRLIGLAGVPAKNHGTLVGGVKWGGALGRQGGWGSLSFDAAAAAQYVSVPHAAALTVSSLAISAWVRPTDQAYRTIVLKDDPEAGGRQGYGLRISTSELALFQFGTGSAFRTLTSATPLAVGAWTHVLATYDGTTGRIYLNGREDVNGAMAGPVSVGTGPLVIGQKTTGDDVWYGGLVDEVCVYSRGPSAAEVYALVEDSRRGGPRTLSWIDDRAKGFAVTAGGTTFTKSYSDNLALSDTFTRTSIGKRALTDNLALSEVFARISNSNRALTDTFALSDTFTRTSISNRALTDNLSLSDIFSRTSIGNRTYSDNLALSDTFNRIASANRTYSDQHGLSDTISRLSIGNRALTDNVALSDIFARLSDAKRSLSDNLVLSDVFARLSDAKRSLTDNLVITDTATLVLVAAGAIAVLISDSLGLSDTYSRRADASRALSDLTGMTDTMQRQVAHFRALLDNLGITESTTAIISGIVLPAFFLTGNIQRNVDNSGNVQRNVGLSANARIGS